MRVMPGCLIPAVDKPRRFIKHSVDSRPRGKKRSDIIVRCIICERHGGVLVESLLNVHTEGKALPVVQLSTVIIDSS